MSREIISERGKQFGLGRFRLLGHPDSLPASQKEDFKPLGTLDKVPPPMWFSKAAQVTFPLWFQANALS